MRQWQKVVVALVMLAGAIIYFSPRHSPAPTQPSQPPAASTSTSPSTTSPPSSIAATNPNVIPSSPSGASITAPPAPAVPTTSQAPAPISSPRDQDAATDSPPGLEPHIAETAVRNAVQKYGSTFGGNPVGTNAEITAALNGDNPSHARFLTSIPGQQIDSNGNLTDSWGTPYFFHQLSASDMEVRSAGPDRVMWTSDDIILK